MENEKIKQLMDLGWNIHIECKGKGRMHEGTFEIQLSKVITDDMTVEERVKAFYPKYSFCNNLEKGLSDLLDDIQKVGD